VLKIGQTVTRCILRFRRTGGASTLCDERASRNGV